MSLTVAFLSLGACAWAQAPSAPAPAAPSPGVIAATAKGEPGEVAAVVDGEPITKQMVVDRLLSYFGNSILESMITDLLLEQEARRRGVSLTEEETNKAVEALQEEVGAKTPEALEALLKGQGISLTLFRYQARRFALLEKVFAQEVRVTDEEVEKIYREHKGEYLRPEMVLVRSISVATEGEAQGAIQRLQKGEDFEAVAKELTTDPRLKATAGATWRYFRGQKLAPLPTSIENDLFAAPVGTVRGPFKAEGVFHIFKLEQKLDAHQATLDEVRDTLKEALHRERLIKLRTETWPNWLEEQMKKAKIERQLTF